MTKLNRLRAAVFASSLLLYVAACALPVSSFSISENGSSNQLGFTVLLMGWIEGESALLAWSSNFLWMAAMVLLAMGRPRPACVVSAIGLLFASRILLPDWWARLLEAKYWWLASYSVLVVGSGTVSFLSKEVAFSPGPVDAMRVKPAANKGDAANQDT